MKLNTVLKYYLLTVVVSALIPFCLVRINSNAIGSNSVNPLKEMFTVIGIMAVANVFHFLLLIKTNYKGALIIVPFATVIPAIVLYCSYYNPQAFIIVHMNRVVASVISIALNIFLLTYAYEKILSGRTNKAPTES